MKLQDGYALAFPTLLRSFMDETRLSKGAVADIAGLTKPQLDQVLAGKLFVSAASLYALIAHCEMNQGAADGYGYLVPSPDDLSVILQEDVRPPQREMTIEELRIVMSDADDEETLKKKAALADIFALPEPAASR